MSNLRNSHPFFKNRINKYLDNPDEFNKVKTWVDVEISNKPEVDDYKNIQYNVPTDESASSFKLRFNLNSKVALDSYNELEGLYCENTKFNIKTRVEADSNNTCAVRTIYCHKCDICLGFRRLDIMSKLLDKLDHHSEVDRNNLYHLIINNFTKQGLNPSKITKRMKYLDVDGMLMYTIDEKEDTITYLFNDNPWFQPIQNLGYDRMTMVKVSFDYAISHFGLNDKYRFLGKFYAKTPSVRIRGISKTELNELENHEHYENDRCKCGELEVNHVYRSVSIEELKYNIEPEDHYKKDFNRFLKNTFDYEREGQQKL